MIRALLAIAALALAAPAVADGHAASEKPLSPAQIGPTVGQEAPPITAANTAGVARDLTNLASENGLALVFVRSADWCPFCKAQLKDLEAGADDLEAAGWTLAAISYDSVETLATFKAAEGLTYTLLSDEGSETIDAFGLRDSEAKGRAEGAPHPAVVFIRAEGTVAGVMREEGYKDRPQLDAILDAAALLNDAAS